MTNMGALTQAEREEPRRRRPGIVASRFIGPLPIRWRSSAAGLPLGDNFLHLTSLNEGWAAESQVSSRFFRRRTATGPQKETRSGGLRCRVVHAARPFGVAAHVGASTRKRDCAASTRARAPPAPRVPGTANSGARREERQ